MRSDVCQGPDVGDQRSRIGQIAPTGLVSAGMGNAQTAGHQRSAPRALASAPARFVRTASDATEFRFQFAN